MGNKIDLTQGFTLLSDEPDGATSVAFDFDTDNAYSTSGAKLLSLSSNGTEKCFFDKNGNLVLNGQSTAANIYAGGSNADNAIFTIGGDSNATEANGQNYEFCSFSRGNFYPHVIPGGLGAAGSVGTVGNYNLTGTAPTFTAHGGDCQGNADNAGVGGTLELRGGNGLSTAVTSDASGGNVTLAGGTGYGTGSNGKVVFSDGLISSSVADGATAVAFDFDTDNAYSTAGAKLASWSNNGAEKAYIDKDGNIKATKFVGSTSTQTMELFHGGDGKAIFSAPEINLSGSVITLKRDTGTGELSVTANGEAVNLTVGATQHFRASDSAVRIVQGLTVATLPTTPAVGMIARVTDADTPVIGSTVTGGGAAAALVWYDGTNWVVTGGSDGSGGGGWSNMTEAVWAGGTQSEVADGATAVAFDFDTDNAYSTAGAKLASWSNNGTEKAYIDKDGNLDLSGGKELILDSVSNSGTNPTRIKSETTGYSITFYNRYSSDPPVAIKQGLGVGYNSYLGISQGSPTGNSWSLRTVTSTDFPNTEAVSVATARNRHVWFMLPHGLDNTELGYERALDCNFSLGAGGATDDGLTDGGDAGSFSIHLETGGDGSAGSGTDGADSKFRILDNVQAELLSVNHSGKISTGKADGATAVAFDFDTDNAYSTSGASLLNLSNNGTTVWRFNYQGGIDHQNSGATTEAHEQSLNLNWSAITTQTSSGQYSAVIGVNNTASNLKTVAIGDGCTANTPWAMAFGKQSSATAEGAMAFGEYASATIPWSFAFSGGYGWGVGNQQAMLVIPHAATTDATQTTLLSRLGEELTIPADTTWCFSGLVAARSDETDGNVSAAWRIDGALKRDEAGNTAMIGTPAITEIAKDTDAAAWDVTAEADDVNDALAIKVTGEAATNIHWVCKLDISQVGYA